MAVRKGSKLKFKTWAETKKKLFQKSPDAAIEYLKAAMEDNGDVPELVIEAIRSVSEALGMSIEQIAKKAHKAPSTIHKALGKDGNPSLETLTSILKTMGLKLSIKKAS
jgi:probable addiction module antidote protein